MSLPNSIDKSSPLGTDDASGGAAQIRNLKEAVEDIIGIPNSTSMTGKMFTVSADGTVARQKEPVASKAGDYTLTKDDEIILCSGTFTLTLPAAATVSGKVWKLKKIDAGVITAAGTVDGVVNPVLLTGIYSSGTLLCDGTNYYVLGSVGSPGVANGLATLDENTTIPLDQITGKSATYATSAGTAGTASTANKLTDGSHNIFVTLLDIGDWDMQNVASVSIPHGLTLSNIRSVQGLIRQDDGSYSVGLIPYIMTAAEPDAYINQVTATDIVLARKAGGTFVSSYWNATSYNRGWLVVTHTN